MAILAPLPNNGSQLERAIRAWLVDATADNPRAYKLEPENIFLSNDSRTRNLANYIITVQAARSDIATDFSGDLDWNVKLHIQCPLSNKSGETNPELNRLICDRYAGLVMAAMTQSNGGQDFDLSRAGITKSGRALATGENYTQTQRDSNDDMAEFTCLFIRYTGDTRGHPQNADGDTDRSYWVEERHFKITSCPSAID